MEILKLLVRVIIYLASIFILASCSPGWRVAGYELNPSEEIVNTVFIEIVAHDSTMHWYANNLFHGENYCLLHNRWETVRVK
tara:strand:- start:3763 stop:4008 length:246 start_codon:yes stop_codon:yes gene_type:complete